MNDGPIQLHPEAQRLGSENDLLREELTALLTEVDTLLGTVKPNLLALYQTKIGLWEMRLLQAQCETARQRRKLELVQASLNRGVPPAPSEIEATLELEFLAWQQKLREAAERVQTAEQRLKHLLSPTEDRELKKLYHALVRRLQLLPGMLLPLKREPDNPHDPLAIMILNESGHHLGYVPRAKNEALARLMDAGKLLFGKLESKAWQGEWLKVAAHIYLRDF